MLKLSLLIFYIFKEYAGSEAVRKQEQVVVLLIRAMRKVEAPPLRILIFVLFCFVLSFLFNTLDRKCKI